MLHILKRHVPPYPIINKHLMDNYYFLDFYYKFIHHIKSMKKNKTQCPTN